jgi:hypothetical protein
VEHVNGAIQVGSHLYITKTAITRRLTTV